MKALLLLLISYTAFAADVKISDLPAGTPASVGSNDVFPYVDIAHSVTKKFKLSDLPATPALCAAFAPKSNPTFTGIVTAPSFVGNVTGNVSGSAGSVSGTIARSQIATSTFDAIVKNTADGHMGTVTTGSEGQVLKVVSGVPAFANESGGGSGVSKYANFAALPGTCTDADLAITIVDNVLYSCTSNVWSKVYDASLPLKVIAGVTSIAASSSVCDGYLKKEDFATFLGKQDSISFGNLSSGSELSISGGTGAVKGAGATVSVASGYTIPTTTEVNAWNSIPSVSPGNVTTSSEGVILTGATGATAGPHMTVDIDPASAICTGVLKKEDFSTFAAKEPALSKGNLTSGTELSISGGTGAVIGAGAGISVASGYVIPTSANASYWNAKQENLAPGNVTTSSPGVILTGGTTATVGPHLTVDINAASSVCTGLLTLGDWQTFYNKMTSPMSALGDLIYGAAAGVATRLAGNTTTTRKFLSQVGDGVDASSTSWVQPSLSCNSDVTLSSPVVNQFLSFNGTHWFNSTYPIGAGNGVNFYLDDSGSDIGGYNNLYTYPSGGTEQDDYADVVSGTSPLLIEPYVSTSAGLGKTLIDGGVWIFSIWANTSSTSGSTTTVSFNVYKRAGAVETLLFSAATPALGTTISLHEVETVQPSFVINSTDRLVIKMYATNTSASSRRVHFYHNGTAHYTHIHTPLIQSHNDLAGLYGGAPYNHLTNAELATVASSASITPVNHAMVVSSSTTALSTISPVADTCKVLVSGGSSSDPSWQKVSSAMVTSGTGNSNKVLTAHGDDCAATWETPTGGGTTYANWGVKVWSPAALDTGVTATTFTVFSDAALASDYSTFGNAASSSSLNNFEVKMVSLPIGGYYVKVDGALFSSSSSTCFFGINDGTTTKIVQLQQGPGGSLGASNFGVFFNYSSVADRTFSVGAFSTDGGTGCGLYNNTTTAPGAELSIAVFPISGQSTTATGTSFQTHTTTGDINTSANFVLCNMSSPGTLTLPVVSSNLDYRIKSIGTAACTIKGNGSELIDRENTLTITTQDAGYGVASDGSVWRVY
jgi:hypothetical protein